MATDSITTVTVNGRNFIIHKFTAKAGLKMARFVIAKLAPLIPLLDTGDEKDSAKLSEAEKKAMEEKTSERIYEIVGVIADKLSDADIDYLVDHCLVMCSEKLPVGETPVLDETGNYGVEGVEDDPILTLTLCYHAIAWGASAFFGANNSALTKIAQKIGKSQNQ